MKKWIPESQLLKVAIVDKQSLYRNQQLPHKMILINQRTVRNRKIKNSDGISLREGFEPTNLAVHLLEPSTDIVSNVRQKASS